jgi:thioredoxin 1
MSKFDLAIQSKKPVLVDFYASWCKPCATMSPILDQLQKKNGATLTVLKIDVDRNQSLALRFKIKSIPTLILFKEGKILWKESGVFTLNGLQNKLAKFI